MNELPPELRYKPTPLVALVGGSSEITSAIEKGTSTFVQESVRSVPIFRYLILPAKECNIPPRSDKDKPLDYQPEGILASGWLLAVSHKIPACVVYIIDWDAPDWKIKEFDNYAAIDSLKQSTRARNIHLMILIVKRDPFNPTDERLSAFKRKTQLDSRSIHLFVMNDFGLSMQVFENSTKKSCIEYYNEEIKHIKRRREKFSKTVHSKLFVRASFKLGFYSELSNDITSALKHYTSAYAYLRDVKKNWKDFDEIKVIAEVINFRLCYLNLEKNNQNGATTQFHQHVNYYRSLIGDPDREFQHYAWVSRQYQMFGELLQVFAYLAPLPPPSIHSASRPKGWTHPGYYFQAAANFESIRRASAVKICYPLKSKESISKLLTIVKPYKPSIIDLSKNGYIGQKVDISTIDSSANSNLNREAQNTTQAAVSSATTSSVSTATSSVSAATSSSTVGTSATLGSSTTSTTSTTSLAIPIATTTTSSATFPIASSTPISASPSKTSSTIVGSSNTSFIDSLLLNSFDVCVAQELLVNHSFLIMRLLGIAQEHYRLDHAATDRTLWFLTSQIAQEAFLMNDFVSAKLNNDQVIAHYRREKWWGLLAPCLKTNLQCSIQLKEWDEVIRLCVELLSPNLNLSQDEKKDTLNMIFKILDAHKEKDENLRREKLMQIIASSQTSQQQRQNVTFQDSSVPQQAVSDIFLSEPISIIQSHSHQGPTLMKCNVQFEQNSASIHTDVRFSVTLQSNFPGPIRFDLLRILFTDSEFNQSLADPHDKAGPESILSTPMSTKKLHELADKKTNLIFLPNRPKTFEFSISFKHVAKIQCTGVILGLGKHPTCLELKWDWTSQKILHLLHSRGHRKLLEQSTIEILEHDPKITLDIEQESPALVGEHYPILLRIINQEDRIVSGKITLRPHNSSSSPSNSSSSTPSNPPGSPVTQNNGTNQSASVEPKDTAFESQSGRNVGNTHEILFNVIEPNQEYHQLVHFIPTRQKQDEDHYFIAEVSYETDSYSTSLEKMLTVPVRTPFKVNFDIYDEQFKEVQVGPVSLLYRKDSKIEPTRIPVTPHPLLSSESSHQITVSAAKIPVGSNFFVRAEIINTTNFPLLLNNIDLLPSSHHQQHSCLNVTRSSNGQTRSKSDSMEPVSLNQSNKYSIWFAMKSVSPMSHQIGNLQVSWARNTGFASASPVVTTWTTAGPVVYAESPPFTTKLSCPDRGIVGQPLAHNLEIHNLTETVLCLALEVEENPSFAIAGDKKAQYRINQGASLTISHTIVPLKIGVQKCPTVLVKQLASDGSGLGLNGVLEQPYLTLSHPNVFIEPVQASPLLV